MKKRWFLYEATALFGADQICKTYVEQNLDSEEEKRLTDRVVLRRAHNRGISFGILKDTPKAVLTLSVLAASIVTVIQHVPEKEDPAQRVFIRTGSRGVEQYV